jgi:hypothetical protein
MRIALTVLAVLVLFPATQAFAQPAEQPVIGPPRGDALHAMSFNLRYASDSHGPPGDQ